MMVGPLPFKQQAPVPSGGHIIGQPFAIENLSIPVNCAFTCKCVPGNAPMVVQNSSPVTCASCTKTYVLAFNPANQQIMVALMQPADQVTQ